MPDICPPPQRSSWRLTRFPGHQETGDRCASARAAACGVLVVEVNAECSQDSFDAQDKPTEWSTGSAGRNAVAVLQAVFPAGWDRRTDRLARPASWSPEGPDGCLPRTGDGRLRDRTWRRIDAGPSRLCMANAVWRLPPLEDWGPDHIPGRHWPAVPAPMTASDKNSHQPNQALVPSWNVSKR